MVVKHRYHWSYEQAKQWVSDSLVLRQFCRIYTAKVPDDTTLLRWANLIQPQTLERLLEHVVALAQKHHLNPRPQVAPRQHRGRDQCPLPVDSTRLTDGVRVLARTIRRAKPLFEDSVEHARTLFRDRTRRVCQVTKQLIDASRRRSEQAAQEVKERYEQLLDLTQQVVQQAQQVQQQQ